MTRKIVCQEKLHNFDKKKQKCKSMIFLKSKYKNNSKVITIQSVSNYLSIKNDELRRGGYSIQTIFSFFLFETFSAQYS